MKKIVFLFLLFTALGCKVNEEQKDKGVTLDHLDLAPKIILSIENLPKFIKEIVIDYERFSSDIIYLYVYHGEWNNRTVYLTQSTFQSALFQFYYGNGDLINFSINDPDYNSFYSTSKNWVLIYEFGQKRTK